MVSRRAKTEAATPPAVVDALLRTAGEDMVLVGGQALAFWVERYAVPRPANAPAVSNDVDFLAPSASDRHRVMKIAGVLDADTVFPRLHGLSALVGQVVKEVSESEYINVDVIHKVVGLDGRAVRARAVRATRSDAAGPYTVLVMHPLDVLRSRVVNLHKLREKRDAKGEMQLRLAIAVAREFLREQARTLLPAPRGGRSPIQPFISAIEQLAIEDAGRKVASRHRIFVADAIDPLLIPPGPFWQKRWPGLQQLMSPAYASRIEPPASNAPTNKPKRSQAR